MITTKSGLRFRLDSAALRSHLSEAGNASGLDRLCNDRVYTVAPFAKPSASLDQARAGWREIWRRLEAKRTQVELRAAGHALGQETSETNLARVMALHAEFDGAERDGAERDGSEGDDPGSA